MLYIKILSKFFFKNKTFLIFYFLKTIDMPEDKTPDEKEAIEEIRKPVARPRWLIPLVTIVIVVFFLWYFSRSCGETKPNIGESPDATGQVHRVNNNFVAITITSETDQEKVR